MVKQVQYYTICCGVFVMNLKETEQKLKDLIEKDRNDEQIYTYLKALTVAGCAKAKFGLTPTDIDEVSHDVATDLFLRVRQGLTVEYWRAYINRLLYTNYVQKQRNSHFSEIFELKDNPELEDSLYRASASSGLSDNDMARRRQNYDYLLNIKRVIYRCVNGSRYPMGTPDGLALYTSVSLSFYYGKETYFKLRPEVKPFVHIVMRQVVNDIIASGFAEDSDETNLLHSTYMRYSFDDYRRTFLDDGRDTV